MHIFPYSLREGTAAARMPGHLAKGVKEQRVKTASAVAALMEKEYMERQIGRTLDVIFERDVEGRSLGYSGNYVEVGVGLAGLKGERRQVKITRVYEILEGELI